MHARSATDINHHYRTLRPQLLMYMVIGYAAFYLTRKSVNYVLPALQTDLGLDKGDIGLLGSLFYLTYGLSKFAAGLWHDSHGQRWFMGAGLFATGLLNVVFAFGESLTLLLAVWTLNGFFQGWGWPPCARLLTHWYASGIWLTLQLKGTPQEEGFPSVGIWRNDPLELRQERQSPPMGLWQMLRTTMLKNPMIWLLGVSYVLVYLIRIALNDWGNIWLTESHGVNLLSANATVMLFEAGGLLGALFAGWGSDLLFSGQRAPMILLFTLGLMVSVAALWLAPVHHYALLAVCFFTVVFFVFGPQMLIGLAAVECGHKAAAGSISGFLGLFAYLGAALAGWPLSLVIERYGWSGMFSLLSVAAVLMGLLLMPLLMASITTSAAQG
ncbi:MAG: MFS transporter [Klebsiella grimontii]|nr:MFS transporter [Klebsiella grimontii]